MHKLSGITDGAAGGGDLDGVAARGDGESGSSTLVPGRESTLGILGAGILGSGINREIRVLETSHDGRRWNVGGSRRMDELLLRGSLDSGLREELK